MNNTDDPTKPLDPTEPLDRPEETTKDLSDSEMLDLILSRLSSVESRLAALEEDRTRETRPKLDLIHKEIADMRIEMREGQARTEDQLEHVKTKLDLMVLDAADMRTVQHRLGARVSALERAEIERRPSRSLS
jgi:hypothetical protein